MANISTTTTGFPSVVDTYTAASSGDRVPSAHYNGLASAVVALQKHTFGVFNVKTYGAAGDGATDDAVAIQAADTAASAVGGVVYFPPGTYLSSTTLYCRTIWIGANTENRWDSDGRGTILKPTGSGTAARWTDITGSDAADFIPFIVMARSDSALRDMTVKCGATAWSAGIYVPCVKRVKLSNVDTPGAWSKAGLYLDATWSDRNTTLAALHPTVEADTGLNEFGASNCFFEGLWGVWCQGTTRAGNAVASESLWLWGWGGTSDMAFYDCRLGSSTDIALATRQADGGGFKHDAQLYGVGTVAQGHNFVNCSFRSSSKYLVLLDRSNRDTFVNCYGETIDSATLGASAVFGMTANTGEVCRISDRINADLDFSGVTYTNGNGAWPGSINLTVLRSDGRLFTPNIRAAGTGTSLSVDFKSWTSAGQFRFYKTDGTTETELVRLDETVLRPAASGTMTLGSSTFPFLAVGANEVRMGGSTSNPTIKFGSGTPEGSVTAVVGSIYLRTNGGAGTSLYVKESGSGNTGWVAK